MQEETRKHWFGEFELAGTTILGELTVSGEDTNLYLQNEKYFSPAAHKSRTIYGSLRDKRSVTLIDCNLPQASGSSHSKKGSYRFANIFPHYIIFGDLHLNPEESVVSRVSWKLDDIDLAFYDFDAFGTALNPEKFINDIVADNEKLVDRKISIGPHPEIQYFNGRFELFSSDLGFGTFSVAHGYNSGFGGTSGVWMKNRISAALQFHTAIRFHDALEKIYDISTFLGLVTGRPQNVESIRLRLVGQSDEMPSLEVTPSLPVKREGRDTKLNIGPTDVLLNGMERQDEFSSVLRHWIATGDEFKTPRRRLWDSYKKQSFYDADRIIAAANLFDTIPSHHFPKKVTLSPDFISAIEASKKLFKALPNSTEKESILGELSRLSKPKLKSKIKSWASCLNEATDHYYKDLDYVIDRAVNCRNYFVHGAEPDFDYFKNFNLFTFLTRALEFCYVAPEFIKGGWNFRDWRSRSGMFHPFGNFTFHYQQNVEKLQALVVEEKAARKMR